MDKLKVEFAQGGFYACRVNGEMLEKDTMKMITAHYLQSEIGELLLARGHDQNEAWALGLAAAAFILDYHLSFNDAIDIVLKYKDDHLH